MKRAYKSGITWALWRWTHIESDHIERLHIVKTPWFAICLHWLKAPDPEPYLHDHPVSFLSFVLRGGYSEIRNGIWRNRPCFNFVRASPNDAHRIVFVEPDTLTLSFMGPKRREWGFHTERGWVDWRDYYASAE